MTKRLFSNYLKGILMLLLASSCSTEKRMLPVVLNSSSLKISKTADFDMFVFEYKKRTAGGRLLKVSAFKTDGTQIGTDFVKLHKAKGPGLSTKDLALSYKGHIVLKKKLVDSLLNVKMDYFLQPKPMIRKGVTLPYVSYSVNIYKETSDVSFSEQKHQPSKKYSSELPASEKRSYRARFLAPVIDALDPSPPADL